MEKKLNILFLSQVTISSIDEKNIYTDLLSEFLDKGHKVTILSAVERRNKKKFSRNLFPNNCEIYWIKTPNLQKTSAIEKVIGHLAFDFQLLFTIKKYLRNHNFDICLYFSPPITITKTLHYVKKTYNTFNYLWLKDIFPQNAVDMGLMKENSLTHNYFRNIEKKYYQLSDKIGVMSPANKTYLEKYSIEILKQNKVEVCPNCIKLETHSKITHQLPLNNGPIKIVYGGNLGIPQGIYFLIKILEIYANDPRVHFYIIGSGTEFNKIDTWIKKIKPKNINLHGFLPKEEYTRMVAQSDIGLIFLSEKFTIPNFPSRLLTYLECKIPVLCFTDKVTDIGPIAKSNNFGDYALTGDLTASKHLLEEYLLKSREELIELGDNGYTFMLSNYTANHAYEIIINSFYAYKNIQKN